MILFFPPAVVSSPQIPPSGVIQKAHAKLYPLPVDHSKALAAVALQALPDSEVLKKAHGFYHAWRARKRDPGSKAVHDAMVEVTRFKESIFDQCALILASPGMKDCHEVPDTYFAAACDPGSSEFKASLQSSDTQLLKALALAGLTQYWLGDLQGLKISKVVLDRLVGRTPLDPEVYQLLTETYVFMDDSDKPWRYARIGICLKASPSSGDLFELGLLGSIYDKGDWPSLKALIDEIAPSPEVALKMAGPVELAYQPDQILARHNVQAPKPPLPK